MAEQSYQDNSNNDNMLTSSNDTGDASWIHPLPPLSAEESEALARHPEGYTPLTARKNRHITEPILVPPSWLRINTTHQSLSDDEKTTVAKVQERLPNICAPMGDPMHEEDVAFCTERCAIRYLRACRWDADMAVERIGNTLKWRHERRPHVMDPAYVEPEAMNGKLVIDGFDYCGGPVLYITPRLESTKSSQRQVDTMIFFLERAIALMPPGVEKLTFIVDFGGSSVFNSPAPWVTKSIVHTLDQHYPERLHMAILVGTPWYYNQIFKLISAMIDPVTKEKMRVVELSRHKRKTSVVDNNNTNDGNSNKQEDSEKSSSSSSSSAWKRMSMPLGFSGRKHHHQHSSSSSSGGGGGHTDDSTAEHREEGDKSSDDYSQEIKSAIWEVVPPELLHRSVGGQFPFTHDHSVYWERLLEASVHYTPELPIDVDPATVERVNN